MTARQQTSEPADYLVKNRPCQCSKRPLDECIGERGDLRDPKYRGNLQACGAKGRMDWFEYDVEAGCLLPSRHEMNKTMKSG